jgi:hypothetical protein
MRTRFWLMILGVSAACGGGRTPAATLEPPQEEILSVRDRTGAYVRIQPEHPSRHRVAAPVARSWRALAGVYDAIGIPLEFGDARSRRAGNTRYISTRKALAGKPMSTFLRCGTGPSGTVADTYRITLNLQTELRALGSDSTVVYTQIVAHASPADGISTAAVVCATTGVLENVIVQFLRNAVAPPVRTQRDFIGRAFSRPPD